MNGAHDLGGMQGLGPINPEAETDEPWFHDDWERRAFALTLASGMLGQWSLDESRHARECQHPADYLKNSYYKTWTVGLEKMLVSKGLITEDELRTGRAAAPTSLTPRPAAEVPAVLAKGAATTRPATRAPAYGIGDPVNAKLMHPAGHTRAPRYVWGRKGVIAAYHGFHVFPDASAEGTPAAEPLYTVQFSGSDIWGEEPGTPDAIMVDLWEPYLEAL